MTRSRLFLFAYWSLLLALVLGIYLPGIDNQPLFDDGILVDRSIFERYGSLLEFQQRMLSYGSFVWVESVFGEGWWKQRLVNVLLHMGVVVALHAFWTRLLTHVRTSPDDAMPLSREAALRVGIALFAVSPVAAYAVGYLIQRSILMATLFAVLACYAFVRGVESRKWVWFLAALAGYVCALLSKGHAVMLVALWVPLFVFVARPRWRVVATVSAASALALAVAVTVLYSVYGDVIGNVFDEASRAHVAQLEGLSPGISDRVYGLSILNQAALFFYYGFFWFVPNVLAMSIDMRPAFPLSFLSFPETLGALAYFALLAGAAWAVVRRSDMLGLAALGLLFPLVLFFTEFSTVWIQDPFVLYRSYLWAIGFPVLVCVLLTGIRPPVLYTLGFVVAMVFAGLAFERTMSMRDIYRVWHDAAEKVDLQAPPNAVGRARAFVNRGSYFLENLLAEQAYRDFVRAIELGEREGSARFNLGVALQLMNRHEQALESFDLAIREGFKHPGLNYHRGETLYTLGRYAEAVEAFTLAIRVRRQDERARDNALLRRAEAAIAARDFERASRDFRTLLEKTPDDVRLLTGLGMAYVGLQDGRQALGVFDALVERGQSHVFHYGRAMALMLLERRREALAEVERALELQPENSAYRQLREQLAR